MPKKPTYKELEQRIQELAQTESELKTAKKALRECRKKYKGIVENIENGYYGVANLLPQAVFEIDLRGNFTFANRHGYEVSGYTPEDINKRLNAFQMFIPEDRERAKQNLQRVLSGEKLGGNEYTAVKKDGNTFPVMIYAAPIICEKKPIGLRGIVVDITERKRTEVALREKEERYRSLVEATDDLVCTLDRNGRYLFANKKYLSKHGLGADNYAARNYQEFHADERAKLFMEQLNQIFETGKSIIYQHKGCHDNTHYIRTMSPIKGADGKTIAVTSISKDITALVHVEDALRENEEKYRRLFNACSVAVIIFDAETLQFVDVNDAALSLYGYTKEEFLKLRQPDITAEPEQSEDSIIKLLSGKLGTISVRYHKKKDGSIFPVEISTGLLTLRERRFLFGFINDITERKQSEESLRASREQLRNLSAHLQSAREQERIKIAREVHDDLGQALTALKMDIFWLKKRLPKEKKQLQEKTEFMAKAVDMGIQTVKKIITDLRPGILDVLGLGAALEWQAEEFQKRTGVKCKLRIDSKGFAPDPERDTALFRIFQEALTNITQHADATAVTARLRKTGAGLELTVRDNGKGITQEQISKPGSFGLSGVRERTHILGGKVEIKGVPGKGTTITVWIPTEKANMDIYDVKHQAKKVSE